MRACSFHCRWHYIMRDSRVWMALNFLGTRQGHICLSRGLVDFMEDMGPTELERAATAYCGGIA